MKKILCTVLVLCMLISILPANVFAASVVNIFNITVTEPKAGAKPVNSATLPATASTEVVKVEWSGKLDSNGCFVSGEKYKVSVSVKIKDGVDKTIKYVPGTTKINGQLAMMQGLSDDKKSAIIYFNFKTAENESTQTNTSNSKISGLSVTEEEWEVLRIANIERAKDGLNLLTMIQELQLCCNIREKEIIDYYSHSRPDGSSCFTVIDNQILLSHTGENIAKGQYNAKQAMTSWMDSPGHRANILNYDFGYIGVGNNPDARTWVQMFSDRAQVVSFTVSTEQRTFDKKSDIIGHYMTLVDKNGFVSYLPLDFDSMTNTNGNYTPKFEGVAPPVFNVTNPDKATEITPEITERQPGEAVNPNGKLFDCFIPIANTYSALLPSYPRNLKAGEELKFEIGTRFDNEMGKWSPDTLLKINRSDYQGGYLKLKYVGAYGSIDKKLADEHMNIGGNEVYLNIIGDPGAPKLTYEHGYDINKNTSVVAIDLYDANKKFVRSISPGCIIVASGTDGSFITYSECYSKLHSIYFSPRDDIFDKNADKSNSRKTTMEMATATVHNKADIEKLLSSAPKAPGEQYKFLSYPSATGEKNLNANTLLNDHEFITPDNTYYYIGLNGKEIDPIVLHKIENVVDYARYNHAIEPGYTQRNVVTADGTLYGLTNKGEKKTIASNVKKTSINHYMTNDGKVVEIASGKVIATDCKDFAEANSAWAIGIIKNDDTFWLSYTYLGDKTAYEKGFEKKLDNAKIVVPEGILDSNNTFYRWNETITKQGMDMNSFMMGYVKENNEYKLNLVKVCDDVIRIFPYEKLSRIGSTNEELTQKTVTGFALTSDGTLHGYGLWYNENFGNHGMAETLFPMRKTEKDGNFIGIKTEKLDTIAAILCRTCDNQRYKKAAVYDRDKDDPPIFVSITRNGFLARDGVVYSFTDTSQADPEGMAYATPNYDKDFGQMQHYSQTFRAYAPGKDPINLLPDVYSWTFENRRTCLLERSDGSVWMAAYHPNSADEDIKERLGGYQNSNPIQITQPTTKKAVLDYIPVDGGRAKVSFSDVSDGAYYAEAVKWAVGRNITAGTSDTTFSPDQTCTRAQILTFLWRALGSPEMLGDNPYKDVSDTDYYFNAAKWAYNMGMIMGDKFEGNTPCTRSATVEYIWKTKGEPRAQYNGNFTDVSNNEPYAEAVAWAVANGVTSGTSATTFSPDSTCTRGQIVTFLMRAMNK